MGGMEGLRWGLLKDGRHGGCVCHAVASAFLHAQGTVIPGEVMALLVGHVPLDGWIGVGGDEGVAHSLVEDDGGGVDEEEGQL